MITSIEGCPIKLPEMTKARTLGPFRYKVVVAPTEFVQLLLPQHADFLAAQLRGMALVEEVVGLAVIDDLSQLDTTIVPIVKREGKLVAMGGLIEGM